MNEKEKEQLEFIIKKFNNGLIRYENNNYLSKHHLLGYVDFHISELVKRFELNIEG